MDDHGVSRHENRETKSQRTKNISAPEARQGRRGVPVLMVLIGGLAFAAIIWAVVEFYGESIRDEDSEVNSGAQAPVEQTVPGADDPAVLPPAGQN